jgi:hypothetical protein
LRPSGSNPNRAKKKRRIAALFLCGLFRQSGGEMLPTARPFASPPEPLYNLLLRPNWAGALPFGGAIYQPSFDRFFPWEWRSTREPIAASRGEGNGVKK